MQNIKYDAMVRADITPSMLHSGINIRDELISQLSERMVRNTDLRIMEILERRLGHKVEPERLVGRLERVVTRGTGYETLLLDGRPLARVYDGVFTPEGFKMTVGQVIEELEG